jgi:hypothetical protein
MVLKRTDYLAVDDRVTGDQSTALVDSEAMEIETTTRDQVELLGALGTDPWKELERPLRPTEIAGMSLRYSRFHISSLVLISTQSLQISDFGPPHSFYHLTTL